MIDKFGGILYLAISIIHFIGYAFYGFRCVVQTQTCLDKYGIDATGAGVVRFFGCFFIGAPRISTAIIAIGKLTDHAFKNLLIYSLSIPVFI